MAWGKARYIGISNCFAWQIAKVNALAEKIVQTAGREQLGKFAPMFSHLNDDCVKIGLNRKSLIESRFSRRSPISLTGKGATSFAKRVS